MTAFEHPDPNRRPTPAQRAHALITSRARPRSSFARLCVATLSLALVCLAHSLCPLPGRAQASDDDTRYRELIRSAVTEFDLGQWQEAIALFREAHRLRPSARTHRGLGQALFEARDYVQAIPHLEAALSAPPATFAKSQREILERALDQAKRFIGSVRLELHPEDASVSIDGQPLGDKRHVALNPGEHTVSVRAPEYMSFQQRFVIEGGREQVLRVQLVSAVVSEAPAEEPPKSAPTDATAPMPAPIDEDHAQGSPLTALGLVSAGLAVASLATAIVVWRVREGGPVQAWQRNQCKTIPDLTQPCLDAESEADTEETVILASAIAGSVLAATAVTLFVVSNSDEREHSLGLRCGVGAGSLLCNGRF